MEMFNIILRIILLLIILGGVIIIYDARIITKKFFGFGDQNEGSLGLKMIGTALVLICGVALFFLQRG